MAITPLAAEGCFLRKRLPRRAFGVTLPFADLLGVRLSVLLVLEQVLNGLQLGVMLFLLAAGLTLVLGIMNLVNLAHGSL